MIRELLKGCAETRYCLGRPLSELESCVMDDLFSLGSLFFEILMGYRLYNSEDSNEIWQRFQEHVFPSMENIQLKVFAGIIVRCWNEEYHSILDMQNDLQLQDS